MKNKSYIYILTFCFCTINMLFNMPGTAVSEIYKCTKDNYTIYQEFPCNKEYEDSNILLTPLHTPQYNKSLITLKKIKIPKNKSKSTKQKKRKQKTQKKCQNIKKELDLIEERFRRGYTVKQSNILKNRKNKYLHLYKQYRCID